MLLLIYQFFPRSHGITNEIKELVNCFLAVKDGIDSTYKNLNSNNVLAILRPYLERLDFFVETGKKQENKIPVPVLLGMDNTIDR